jgi:3-hydroxyacyl-CoA dehydrogenase
MDLDTRLENVAVLGAAGKMGSGISLLLAQEMVRLKLSSGGKDKSYVLHLIDVSEPALTGLLSYLKPQLVKAAEKSIVMLRDLYSDRSDLIENRDIINQFVDDATSLLRPSTTLETVAGARLVFEAIIEDESVKIDVLKKIDPICTPETFYLTNTSSIPIGVLDDGVSLKGRIVGYHFYNPPAVQKLLELITTSGTRTDLVEMAQELAKRLRKKVIRANDVAGFVGNGHFMRDILHATGEVARLTQDMSEPEAIYVMNRVSQDFLVRPMGIFQLVDYVGVDVCRLIMKVMSRYIEGEVLRDDLIDRMAEAGVLGGQRSDGSQKDGFLKYERGRPAGVYDLEKRDYVMFADSDWAVKLDERVGAVPEGHAAWRGLLVDPDRKAKLAAYFKNMADAGTLGAELARSYLIRSKEIGEKLVSDGVANSPEDVNGVLTNGFYHLYGPINEHAELMTDKVGGAR